MASPRCRPTGVMSNNGRFEDFDLGPYWPATRSFLVIAAADAATWTLPGLWPRASRRHKAALAVAGVVHTAAVMRTFRRFQNMDPRDADGPWLARLTASVIARYLAYPALSPRRTYWRGNADNAAFFMQTWTPVVLAGPSRGPRAALTSGAAVGAASYLLAGWINGEPLVPPKQVRRRIANYSVTSALVGWFVATCTQMLGEASIQMKGEVNDLLSRLEREEAAETVETRTALLRSEYTKTLERLSRAADTLIPNDTHTRDQVAALLTGDGVSGRRGPGDAPLSVSLRQHAARLGVSVSLDGDGWTNLGINGPLVRMIAEIMLDNASDADAASVRLGAHRAGHLLTIEAHDDGHGFPVDFALPEGHALSAVRRIVKNHHGRLELGNTEGATRVAFSWEERGSGE